MLNLKLPLAKEYRFFTNIMTDTLFNIAKTRQGRHALNALWAKRRIEDCLRKRDKV